MPHTNVGPYATTPVPRVSAEPPHAAELVAHSKALFAATLELVSHTPAAGQLARMVATKFPVHAGRAAAAAAVVGVAPLDLLTATLCYDLLLGFSGMGCSTLAVATTTGPVLARNMDWVPAGKVARASCLVAESFGANAGFLGMIGVVTGLSENGFAVALNATFGGADPAGYPMLLFLRHVCDTATSYAHALEMVKAERLMSGGIVTVVGRRNDERAVVERTPTQAAVRSPDGDEPVFATNHYRRLDAPHACPRYDHMAAHAGRRPPLEVLTHPEVLQTITAQHVVMCPATGTAQMGVPTHLLTAAEEEYTLAEMVGFFTG
jgi:isopenicillin-N N-acyltransferase like protein